MKKKFKYRSSQVVQPQPVTPKTKEQKISEMWESIEYQIKMEKKFGQEALDKFSKRFSEDAADAFEWSSDTFTAAARVRVAKDIESWIAHYLEKGDEYQSPSKLEVISSVRAALYDEVMRKAKWPERSTSQPHNLIHVEMTSKKAEWLERFDGAIKWIEKE